jgi:hypothetical protein
MHFHSLFDICSCGWSALSIHWCLCPTMVGYCTEKCLFHVQKQSHLYLQQDSALGYSAKSSCQQHGQILIIITGLCSSCEISGSHGSEYEVQSSGMYCRVLNWMSTDISEVHAASIMRAMMEAVCTSETSSTSY